LQLNLALTHAPTTQAITRGDGRCVAETALAFSEHQTCPEPQAFVEDLVDLFSTAVAWGFDVNTSEWMAAVLESVRRHQVHLASEVCSVVVTALVLEGWSNRLDPDICIMEQIRQIVFGGDRLKRRLEDLAKLL
jgi:aarF domain-containing kinase